VKVAATRERLRLLAASLESAQEKEREQLARALEDQVGEPLAAANLVLAQLSTTLYSCDGASEALDQARSLFGLVTGSLESVERISAQLRPGVLDDLGFAAALKCHAREFERTTGIKCAAGEPFCDVALPRPAATTAFRIFTQLLQNVAKPTRATEVKINLRREGEWLTLEVRDNGRGIRAAQIAGAKAAELLRISESARRLGGMVQIRGVTPRGTAATLRIPLPSGQRSR
jgi:signal transduction histidine kinase